MAEGEPRSFLRELKRRRVFRAAVAYAAAAFVILQAADIVFPALLVPDWAFRLLVIVTLTGFPVVLVLAWLFELSPDGLRRAGAAGDPGSLLARVRPRLVYAFIGVVAGGLVAGLALAGVRSSTAQVAAGGDIIAVLPFQATGEDASSLARGMVDLLSRNLDEIGPIRTVDPRAVLHRWEARRDAPPTLQTAREVGLELEAGSILTGTVTEVGRQVRVTAELTRVTGDGDRIASVQLDGNVDDLLRLVDSLSVEIVREIWRARGPVPSASLSGVTTGNVEALRTFLEGEQRYRASDWTAAAAAYDAAVEADSGFALALFRLAQVAGWWGLTERSQREYLDLAERHGARLPAKVLGMVRAEWLATSGSRQAALDTLTRLARQHPDDPELWHQIADIDFHDYEPFPRYLLRSVDEGLQLFERALEWDPTLIPAFIHPLEIAFREGDRGLVRRYVSMLASIALASPQAVATYAAADTALRSSADIVGVLEVLSMSAEADRSRSGMPRQAGRATLGSLVQEVALAPHPDREAALEWISGYLAERGGGPGPLPSLTADLLASGGRLTELEAEVRGRLGTDADTALSRYARITQLAGTADAARWEGLPPLSATDAAAARIAAAVDERDVASLEGALADLRSSSVPGPGSDRAEQEARQAVLDMGDALRAILSGERQTGSDRIEAALSSPVGGGMEVRAALMLRWLDLLADDDDGLHARAAGLLERPWGVHPILELERVRLLARALERQGREDDATAEYGRYAAALAGADPGLPVGAKAAAARDAAGRLARAGGGP